MKLDFEKDNERADLGTLGFVRRKSSKSVASNLFAPRDKAEHEVEGEGKSSLSELASSIPQELDGLSRVELVDLLTEIREAAGGKESEDEGGEAESY